MRARVASENQDESKWPLYRHYTRQECYALKMLRVKDVTIVVRVLKVPSGHHVEVKVLLSALTVIVAFLTRTTPVKRSFRFILVFADDTHAYHQLLNTGYHEKV
jgi:hypothetical protein